ncbi:hypothetical protein ABZV81_25660 [Streptomyces parvus]|uniref:hypothetical protein n=1 Tax=Streptomyces parvus TaxID=66428 RepID=UPI00081AEE5B|nr:hypothetical protein GA0115253_105984 [Streptomyces sp. Termitarium-T10T-6]
MRYFRGAVITDLLAILAMAGALPALTQHLQLVLGLSPLRTSFWLTPQAILAAAAAFVGAALVKRYPPAHVITGGLLTTATGFGPAVFPADLLDRASSTLAEALIAAGEVGGGTGSLLLAAAKESFTEAATVTGIAGAGVMVVAAIWALVTLRGVSANLDLAEEHERQFRWNGAPVRRGPVPSPRTAGRGAIGVSAPARRNRSAQTSGGPAGVTARIARAAPPARGRCTPGACRASRG